MGHKNSHAEPDRRHTKIRSAITPHGSYRTQCLSGQVSQTHLECHVYMTMYKYCALTQRIFVILPNVLLACVCLSISLVVMNVISSRLTRNCDSLLWQCWDPLQKTWTSLCWQPAYMSSDGLYYYLKIETVRLLIRQIYSSNK